MVDLNEQQLDEISQLAKNYFSEGYNCSESVFMAITEVFKQEYQSQLPLLTGLGGGVGGQGYCCGAISGAVVAAGTCFGRDEPIPAKKKQVYEKAGRILNLFKEKYGAVNCSDLKPEDSEIQKKICSDYVGYAAIITAEIINKD
jgi:C_GCAxxG_C_C family probable redox protein